MPHSAIAKMIAGLLLAGVFGSFALAAEVAPAATPENLAEWAVQLDADDFFVRQKATQKLIEAGEPAIAALNSVLESQSLEATTRAIRILQELALSPNLETEEAARKTLKETSTKRFGAVARRATSALETLNDLRRERALVDLEKLGATIQRESVHNGFTVMETVVGIEIGPTFTGKPESLRLLGWIDLPSFQVTFSGPQVTNEFLDYLPAMKTLTSLQLKRTSVTDEGLAVLPDVPRLADLAIMNTAVTDKSFERLKNCQGLTNVRLYGTKFTRDAAQRLQTALGIAKVDFRIGGFLGVGGQQTLQGCQVGIVQDGTAASKAGIQVGDIIVRVGEKKVADFESLTEIIGEFAGGESTELEILREDQMRKIKVTFGEWE